MLKVAKKCLERFLDTDITMEHHNFVVYIILLKYSYLPSFLSTQIFHS